LIDLGLTKLALIGGVALVVIGPERLPTVARVTGRLYGKLQGYLSALKTEVNLQMQADKLKEQMAQQAKEVSDAAKLDEVAETVETFRSVADDMAEAERDYSQEIAAANRSLVMFVTRMRRYRIAHSAASSANFNKKNVVVPPAHQYGFSASNSVVHDSYQMQRGRLVCIPIFFLTQAKAET